MKPATFQRLADQYIEASPFLTCHTRRNTKNAVASLLRFCASKNLDHHAVTGWITALQQEGFEPSTIHLNRACISAIAKWAQHAGHIAEALVPKLRNLPKPQRAATERFITPEEYQRLLTYDHPVPHLKYWPEMIQFSFETGLRLNDCALLKWESLNLDTQVVTIRPSKNRRTGLLLTIPLSDNMAAVLRRRRAIHQSQIAEAMVLSHGRPVMSGPFVWRIAAQDVLWGSRGTISKQFHRLAQACGLKCPQFHGLRHARVTSLLEAGYNTAMVRSITGQSLDTLQRYAEHVSLEAKRAMLTATDGLTRPTLASVPAKEEEESPCLTS